MPCVSSVLQSAPAEKVVDAMAWRHRVRRLARELQALTGRTPHAVVLAALEQYHAQLTGPATPDERVHHALRELRSATGRAGRPKRGPSLTEQDRALGYGPEGV